jgi:hypothetical protein
VTENTGRVTVCSTFDDLLDTLDRHGLPRDEARRELLGAAAKVE